MLRLTITVNLNGRRRVFFGLAAVGRDLAAALAAPRRWLVRGISANDRQTAERRGPAAVASEAPRYSQTLTSSVWPKPLR